MRVRTFAPSGGLLTVLLAASVSPGAAQSASEILNNAYERQSDRMRGVENYTLVQESMGVETLLYFERDESGGDAFDFTPKVFLVNGRDVGPMTGPDAVDEERWDPIGSFPAIAERARYDGEETVDGRSAHKIVVEDLSDIEMTPTVGANQDEGFEARSAVLYLDTDDLVMLRMDLEGTMENEGAVQDVSMTATFTDYREVKGMLHPFRMDVTMEGMAPPDMSAADLEEARASLAEMRAEMEKMPEAQRKMMETMMSGQLERLESMVASGNLEMSLVVKDLRVNEGPPPG